MARTSKCNACSTEISKDEKYVEKGKGYCKKCYDHIIAEKENYKLLIKTICEYFKIDAPTGLIIKQLKQYKEEYGYTNSGITYTLWFIKEIEGKSLSEIKYGIALVKYYYEKAKLYFEQQQKIADSVEHLEVKTKEVKLNLNKVYEKKNEFTFNIDDLLGGE